jgi:hypothetical protein
MKPFKQAYDQQIAVKAKKKAYMKKYKKLHRFLETEDRYHDHVKFLHDGGETEALTGDQIADEVASLAATDPTLALCNSYHDA